MMQRAGAQADLRGGVVRILGPDGATLGTGFVVAANGLVATCSHVVQHEALQRRGEPRPERVTVAFHATGERRQASVDPVLWRAAEVGDLAFLHTDGGLPPGVDVLALGSAAGTAGHTLRTFGFPDASPDDGIFGDGHIVGETTLDGQRVLQLSSPQITPGFSGAPVLDTVTGRVVGMVGSITAPDRYGRQVTTAFVTPTDVLRVVCPLLEVSSMCPYRGLEAFTESDADVFFGRDRAIEKLLAGLRRAPRFLAVLGPSGSGKSSLVQAGLLPRLRHGAIPGSERWGIIVARPADDPFRQLEGHGLAAASASLIEAIDAWLRAHPEQRQLMLVLDQFEELLVACVDSLCRTFIDQLAELLGSPLPITVALVLRDDFYSRFAQQAPALVPWIERGLVNIPPTLEPAELAAIVREPAVAVGLQFEAGLIETVVNGALEVASAQDGTGRVGRSTILPLLEFTLAQLWERRTDGTMTHHGYAEIGGVTGGLAQWADRAFYGLPDGERPLARHVLTYLVHLGDEGQGLPDSRRRLHLAELARDAVEEEAIGRVVHRLAGADARLLVTSRDEQRGQETVELIHEALLREWGLLREWLREDRRFLVWRQALEGQARGWAETAPDDPAGRDADRLLRGRDLGEAEEWLRERSADLDETERRFIGASLNRRRREERKRRWITGIASCAALLFFVVAAFAVVQWWRAEEQREVSLSRQLAAQALALPVDRLDLGLLLSLEAHQVSDTVEARSGLLHGLASAPHLLRFLHGHRDGATSIAISPGGSILVAGGLDGSVRRWDVTSGQPVGRPLAGHSERVNSVAFTPDGRVLVTASDDRTIRLWDAVSGQPVLEPLTGHLEPVLSVAIDPSGRLLASSGGDSQIRLWDLELVPAGRVSLRHVMTGHTGPVASVAFRPDGLRLVSASTDGTVGLWDVSTGGEIDRMVGDGSPVMAVAYHPAGWMIASGGADNTIRLWGDGDGLPIGKPFVGHAATIMSLAFSRDGSTLASGGLDRTIQLWDVSTGKPRVQAFGSHADRVTGLAFTPDGRTVASAGLDRAIRLWDAERGQPLVRRQLLLSDVVIGVTFRRAGDGILVAEQGGALQVWEDRSGGFAPSHVATLTPVPRRIAFSPDGAIAAVMGRDNVVRVLDVATGRPQSHPGVTVSGRVTGLGISPGGGVLAIATADRVIRLWDVARGEARGAALTGHTDDVESMAFSADGRRLVSGGLDRAVRLWDIETGQALGQPLVGHTNDVESVAFSPDGQFVASGDLDHAVRLWDVATGQPLGQALLGHADRITGLAFSPDGQMLGSASADGTVLIWDIGVQSWKRLACRRANRNLSPTEWSHYLYDEPTRVTCPASPS